MPTSFLSSEKTFVNQGCHKRFYRHMFFWILLSTFWTLLLVTSMSRHGRDTSKILKPFFLKTSSFNFYCRKLPVSFCLVSLALRLLRFHGSKRPSWNSSEPGAAHGSLNASIQSAISPVNLEMKHNVAPKTQTSRNGHPKTTTYIQQHPGFQYFEVMKI